MILVDSSIWIEYWKTADSPYSLSLKNLIESDQAAINGLIYHECVQGARNESDLHKLERLLKSITFLTMPDHLWMDSARLSFKMKLKGINLTTVDCLLAAHALHNHSPLFSKDRIFEKVAQYSELKLYRTY